MQLKVDDLMSKRVLTLRPHQSVAHARKVMRNNKIHALPVVGPEDELLGIVSTVDCAEDLAPGSPVTTIMTERVYSIPQYNGVQHAARLMRNHHVHHVVVTHEKRVVGMLSSFDLLKLVEEHRYVPKQ